MGKIPSHQDQQIALALERTQLAGERNRLANERTFLAWVRTGLASVGGGVAVIRLLTFENTQHQFLAQIIGSVLVLLGITIFFLSFLDYIRTNKKLEVKNGKASLFSVTLISIVLILASLILLFITFKLEFWFFKVK